MPPTLVSLLKLQVAAPLEQLGDLSFAVLRTEANFPSRQHLVCTE